VNLLANQERRILLTWRAPAMRRLLVSGLVGLVAVLIAIPASAPWQLTVIAGWNTAAATYLMLVWITISRFSAEQTEAMATIEDNSRHWAGFVLLTASTASLLGVIFGLHRANLSDGALRFWLTVGVITGVVLSWTLVHTVYVLRYAHIYYSSGGHGITFPGDEAPDYLDFAYVAFTLGMTFQVSDNAFSSRRIRRTALAHCLLSYLFGAVIIATSINVIAGLV
jgi:uncharacterized membrane protein